jgi:flagellar hook-length control protein FliK
VIDDLTIAATGGFESSSIGRRTGDGAAAARLSSVFGDLLHGYASFSADEPLAASALVGPGDEPRTPAAADPATRGAPDDPDNSDDLTDRDSRSDVDPARRARREDLPPDGYGDDPADLPEPDRASGGRDEAGGTVSETAAETAGIAAGDGKVPADHPAGPKHGSADAATPGSRAATPTDTRDTAAPTGTPTPLDESLLKSARANPQRPSGPNSAQSAQTTAAAETTAATQRQAGGLAKAIGNGGKAQVSVNVVKEAETLVSRPSFTLASAAAAPGDAGQSKQRSSGKGGQADVGANGPLHPTAARVPPQTAGAPQPPSPLSAQAGATTQAAPAGGVASNAAETSVAPTETVDGDTTGLASAANTLRGAGPTAAQANGAGKLTPDHRPVADQISVNISKAVKSGMDRIEIRLRPESLGRIEVRLEVSHDGRVTAAVTVDNRDTLELLRSDARGLERALQDAGLKADSGSLSFSLRGHDTEARHGGGFAPNVAPADAGDGGAEDSDEPTASAGPTHPQGGVMPNGRIDIRA